MQIYLVGGAVRDRLLNLPCKDKDWVVVGSTPAEMMSLGYTAVGKDFPVFLHPSSKEEYALARTERKNGHGYQGFDFDTSSHVTLEEDLIRRDLTINAMAVGDDGKVIDPYNGQADLGAKLLRHVSQSFIEDPLRVLRVARFAARFYHLGFQVAPETMTLMTQLVASGECQHLTPERVWQETQHALGEKSPWIYFQVLRDTGCLTVVFPELDALFGVPQTEKYHPEIDTGIHTLLALKSASDLSDSNEVRFATLMHDLGKALTDKRHWPSHHGHEQIGIKPVKQLCQRCRVPNSFRDLALIVTEYHTHCHRAKELKNTTILKLLKQTDAFRRPERFKDFLICCKADARGRTGFEETEYPQADYLKRILEELSNLSTQDLVKEGYKGKEIGEQLDKRRCHRIACIKADV